jgi:hypothetical protein
MPILELVPASSSEEYLQQTAKRLADLIFETAGIEKLEEIIPVAIAMYQENKLDLSRILEYHY